MHANLPLYLSALKQFKQAWQSMATLGIYYKISSKSSIVLPTPQELNKESFSFVYKILVGAAKGWKKFLTQNFKSISLRNDME